MRIIIGVLVIFTLSFSGIASSEGDDSKDLPVEDIEIIKNLELLENLEMLKNVDLLEDYEAVKAMQISEVKGEPDEEDED